MATGADGLRRIGGPQSAALGPRNRRVAELRRLIRKRSPTVPYAILEGPRSVAEAAAAGIKPSLVAVPQRALDAAEVKAVLEGLHPGTTLLVISDGVFDSLAPATTPQPMLAIAERPNAGIPRTMEAGDLALVLIDVADPGNVGTIIRSAHACAVRCVVVVGGADPWAPKAVRSSSGSMLRVPVVRRRDAADAIGALRAAGAAIVATDVRSGLPHDSGVLSADRGPVAVLVGSEARGLDRSLDDLVDCWVRIDMAGGTESLNVAMAATLLAFEYRRNRRN